MREHKNQYVFENKSISNLSVFEIQKHCLEIIDTERKDLKDIQPHVIEINSGMFFKPSSNILFPSVAVSLIGNSIILDCPCKTSKTKMCEHQAQVLYNIMERQDLRIFFDENFRRTKLESIAKDYGLENEANLDNFFQLEYLNNSLRIEPKVKGLIKLNADELKQKLLPNKNISLDKMASYYQAKKMILVIRKHRYYDRFAIELFEGKTTQSGKIKNPITAVDPANLLWKTKAIEEAKFFAAVSKFDNNQNEINKEADI